MVLLGNENLRGSANLDKNKPQRKTLLSEKYPSLSSNNLNLKATDIVFVTSKEGNLNDKGSVPKKAAANTLLSSQKIQKRTIGKRLSDPRIEANELISKIKSGEKNVL